MFSGAFAKLRKATVGFTMSAAPSVSVLSLATTRMFQLPTNSNN